MSLRLSVLGFGLVAVLGTAGPSAQSPNLKAEMRAKLTNAQQLLGAVVTADYAGIDRYADRLSRISYTEIASWQSSSQPEYVRQAEAFLLSVKGLRDAAAQRNMASASAEYTALVSSCVQCHATVRQSRQVSLTPDGKAFVGVPVTPLR